MTNYVTVTTSATTSVLVPFNTAANAAAAQTALTTINQFAQQGFIKYYVPAATVSGSVTVPAVSPFSGAVAQVTDQSVNYGVLPSSYLALVNGATTSSTVASGTGTALAVGDAMVVSGNTGVTAYLNIDPNAQAFIGGGLAVILNAYASANETISVDSGSSSVFGTGITAVAVGDQVGGSHTTVTAGDNTLVQVYAGGSTLVTEEGGTSAIFTATTAGASSGAVTIGAGGAASVGSLIYLVNGGSNTFVTPGQVDVRLFDDPSAAGESSATLFGGTLGSMTAAAFTGAATVAGMNGYLEGGSAGGNFLQSGSTAGAATLVAGGANDFLFFQGGNDLAILGSQTGVIAGGAVNSGGLGDKFVMGSGSGSLFGAQDGHNTFVFTGAGQYSVSGFHDTTTGAGSMYVDSVSGTGGVITINDFAHTFDTVSAGAASVTSLATVAGGSGGGQNWVAHLSDGTTINFNNAFGAIASSGTSIS